MSVIIRNKIPALILLITGLILLADYYLVLPISTSGAATDIKNLATAIAAFAVGVGTISLVLKEGKSVSKRKEGWVYSAWTLLMLAVFLVVGLAFGITSEAYKWFFDNVYSQILITNMSLLSFYAVYAHYRAFVARSIEGAIMLLAASFTLMGQSPVGAAIWPGFDTIYRWIGEKASVGPVSGYYICGAIGATMIALRILVGKEKAALG